MATGGAPELRDCRRAPKCLPPYAKTAVKSIEGKQSSRQLPFAHNFRLQSEMVSRRSRLQDCSTHQTKSVQSCDGVSDIDSYKSNRTDNFCLISPSKRNRAESVPTGQLRWSISSVLIEMNGKISKLLEECSEKLNLNMAARVFLADGTEALEPKDIPHDADVYISTGETFLYPFKKTKDHLSLMKKVSWTVNGLDLHNGVKQKKTKPVISNSV
ncbi:LOW QUALITY PROTEIN: doublecortin domain-containing protein 1 [Pluvialis apricaria]